MKVIMVGGYPGAGKSTIVKGVIDNMVGMDYHFVLAKYGKMTTYLGGVDTFFLGSYGKGELFPGTDRLPMNVQPEVQEFLLWNAQRVPDGTVVAEGDRLFNGKMLEFIMNEASLELVLCVVEAQHSSITLRRNARSNQNETWRKGRESKVDRISMAYAINHTLYNSTKEEQEQSISELTQEILGTWKAKKPPQSKISNLWK